MKKILEENNEIILRFDKDEEAIELLANFCDKPCWFQALGAAKGMALSFYDLEKKVYLDKEISAETEIVSLYGNVSKMEGKTIVHCHGVFSDSGGNIFAGHVKKMIVGPTCEVFIRRFNSALERQYDEQTGLNLLKWKQ